MEDKAIVYWAPPCEWPSLKNTVEELKKNNLVKTRLVMEKITDHINPGDKVGVKLHVGESGCTRYIRHDYIREVIDAIKSKGGIPTLIETQGIGLVNKYRNISDNHRVSVGSRKNIEDHMKIAHLHGFTEDIVGAPFKFVDGEKGVDGKLVEVDGIHIKKVAVAADLFEFDKLVVVSRFKGHPQMAFGGAMKNVGIGLVTKRNKSMVHWKNDYRVNPRKCDTSLCSQECEKNCPVGAITIENDKAAFNLSLCVGCRGCLEVCPVKKALRLPSLHTIQESVERFTDNAAAVLMAFGREKIRYINFAIEITLVCDCAVSTNMPICPDLGVFGSSDPLAIDKACLDAEIDAPGLPTYHLKGYWTEPVARGVEKFKALNPLVDAQWQIDAAIKNKLGNINYELVQI